MKNQVLGVDEPIQRDKRDGDGQPQTRLPQVKQPKAFNTRPPSGRHRQQWHQKSHDNGVDNHNPKIDWPATATFFTADPFRPHRLERHHHHQHTQENTQP